MNQREAAVRVAEVALKDARAAGLNDRALLALSYLRDLLPKHPQPQAPIRHVRTFLTELRDDPARVFVPLPE